MRKSAFVFCLVFILLALIAIGALSHFRLDLVHYAVRQAVLQKVTAEVSRQEIGTKFDQAYRKHSHSRPDQYLERLLEISQRIEKLQALDAREMEWIVQKLENR